MLSPPQPACPARLGYVAAWPRARAVVGLVAAGAGPVASPDDVLQQIAAAKKAGHKNILVRVEREGNFRFITMPIETG